MLHAHIQVAQILDIFQVRASITEFFPGEDPVLWTAPERTLILPDGWEHDDALTTTLRLLRLWSGVTIRE